MKIWQRILVSTVVLLVILAIALPILGLIYADFVVDMWWYDSLGYGFYFWQRLLYNYVVFGVATTLFFLFFYYNFRTAARNLSAPSSAAGDSDMPALPERSPRETRIASFAKDAPSEPRYALQSRERTSKLPPRGSPKSSARADSHAESAPTTDDKPNEKPSRMRSLLHLLRQGSSKAYLPLSLILAVVIAYPLYTNWEETLLFVFAPAAGISDPFYGKDISYYLFALPLFRSILSEVFIALLVLFVGVSLLYFLEARRQRKVTGTKSPLPNGAKRHLSILVTLIFLIALAELVFQRHMLLYTDRHLPLFYGPGYTEAIVILPLIWVSIVMLILFGASTVWYLNRRRGLPLAILLGVLFAGAVGLRYLPAPQQLIQDYLVVPDELARQEPYLRYNIAATLDAFDLANVETRSYFTHARPDMVVEPAEIGLRNIPVWDREVLLKVYRELQEIRTYYRFLKVDIDRYTIDGIYQQVFLGARELDFENLPEDSQNWINRWFKYTHGYGAVMSPAAQVGELAKEWFLKDIPPQSDHGLEIAEPGIYFGMQDLHDVIAPNRLGEISFPGEDGVVLDDYHGTGGIPIYNHFRRAVFALYYRDYRLFFSNAIRPDSQILIRREVTSTIQRLTPFFKLDGDPYLVVTPERLYWIQDAYTVSERYPYAEPVNHGVLGDDPDDLLSAEAGKAISGKLNYIRNSVKIVVDAYNGTMHYYLSDPRDPIARGYRRIYPGLIKGMDRFPEQLRPHVRYPRDLFQTQMEVYAKYHQTDPAVFYGQEDRWTFPHVQRDGQLKAVTPYFVTLNLLDKSHFEHLLLVPMNPEGRENMRAIAVAGSDGDNYGRIIVYSFPTGVLVHGLSQVEALIDQDPLIAEQFTLWGQGGAQVERGNLILILVDDALTYVQPVYLKAARGVQIPQLKRVIVSQGGLVAMERSLEEAFAKLRERRLQQRQRTRGGNADSPGA